MSQFTKRFIALVITTLLGPLACGSGPYIEPSQVPYVPLSKSRVVEARSKIAVVVAEHQELSGEFKVYEDGVYVQPLVGSIQVEGKKPSEVAALVAAKLKGKIINPRVSVAIAEGAKLRISILGEVQKSGLQEVDPGTGVLAAIAKAEGFTEFADPNGIYVIRSEPNQIRVRFDLDELMNPKSADAKFLLRDRDTIYVE